jgi:LPS sulfotransferase NodH
MAAGAAECCAEEEQVSAVREHPFRKLYRAEFDFTHYPEEPRKTYFLSAIPRTGSTWFSLQLWRTGVLGAPLEYLNMGDRVDDTDTFSGDIHAYWRWVRQRRTSPNGVFGSKLFTGNIRDVFDRQHSALQLITADYLINLRRRDHVQQAVSYARARQTKIWIGGGVRQNVEASYDFDLLLDCLDAIERQEASWKAIAERTGARVLTLYYENYSADPDAAIRKILRFMNVSEPVSPLTHIPDIPKQRDAISAEWVRRFTAELGERHHHSTSSAKKEKDHASTAA